MRRVTPPNSGFREKLATPFGHPFVLLAIAVQQLDPLPEADKREFQLWIRPE
jgi:hypothetical protein